MAFNPSASAFAPERRNFADPALQTYSSPSYNHPPLPPNSIYGQGPVSAGFFPPPPNTAYAQGSTAFQLPPPPPNTAYNPAPISFGPIHRTPMASVKHMTCWYWAKGHCKYEEHQCLYAHRHTGSMAGPPVKVENDRPAVAGRNAMSGYPVYQNWRRDITAESKRRVQRSIDNIIRKAELDRAADIARQNEAKDAVILGLMSYVRTAQLMERPMAQAIETIVEGLNNTSSKVFSFQGDISDIYLLENDVRNLIQVHHRVGQVLDLLAEAQETSETILRGAGLDELIEKAAEAGLKRS